MRTIILRGVALSALIAVATPGVAQEHRAKQAIAAARAKVEASAQVGTSGDAPGISAEARAALRTAEEQLARGNEKRAIDAANEAQRLADTAIGVAQRNQQQAQAAVVAGAAADVNAAQGQAAAAQDQAAAAQAQAAAAEARANAAERSAAAAQAEAAARATPPAPASTTTTVQTETPVGRATTTATAHKPVVATKRVVHRPAARPATVRTTTTVTTKAQ